MRDPIAVKRADILALINATFPDYRGRKFKVIASGRVFFSDLNWSGGSRSQYRACTLDGKLTGTMDKYNHAHPWDHQAEGKTCEIPRGACVVRHSIFCGKDTGLTVYIHPEDMPKLLPVS